MGPRYANEQLRAVSLHAYFPGRFAVLGALEALQDELGTEWPDLFVPNVPPNQAPALLPYVLRSSDQRRALHVAINHVGYVAHDYPGYSSFVAAAAPLLHRVLELGRVSALNRIVYRYDNAIALSRMEDGTLPIGDFLSVPLTDAQHLTALDLRWTTAFDRGQLDVHLKVEGTRPEQLLLEVIGRVDARGPVDALLGDAALAHGRALDAFEGLITDRFRAFLEGTDAEATRPEEDE